MSKSQRQNSITSNVSSVSTVSNTTGLNSVIRGLEYTDSKYKISDIVSNLVDEMVADNNLTNEVLKELVKNLKGNYATHVTIFKLVIAGRTELKKANLKKEKESKSKAVARGSTKGSTNATAYKGGRPTRPPPMNNRLLSSEESEDSDASGISKVSSTKSSKHSKNTKNTKNLKNTKPTKPTQGIPQSIMLTSDEEENTVEDIEEDIAEEDTPANNTRSNTTKTNNIKSNNGDISSEQEDC